MAPAAEPCARRWDRQLLSRPPPGHGPPRTRWLADDGGTWDAMSKRHQQQAKKREAERISSRSSASRFHVTETRRRGEVSWLVWDGSTVVAGPMERGDRARAIARRLSEQAGLGSHVTVHHARPHLERPQPGKPLVPFVEAVLEGAGCITGTCPHHPT